MNNNITIGLLTLIIGLFLGYTLSPQPVMNVDQMEEMHEEVHDDFSSGVMQHAMEEMMRPLANVEGEEYEKAFLEMMIVHHVGAIRMAEELLEQTDRPELVAMANDIIEVQTTEVEMMEAWLSEWFNQN